MRKIFSCLLFLVVVIKPVISQQPEQLLVKWANESPIEKVYLHYDRSGYFAGQTIWFKSYIYSEFVPSVKSTSLFVELLNSSSKVISRQVYPIFGGFTRGQIELPDSLSSGNYMVRAYTHAMLNHDPEFLYRKSITVIGKNFQQSSVNEQAMRTRVEFFPEGGNFVNALSNTLAFKFTNQNGLPVSASGKIHKSSGEVVTSFSSSHDGMGYVDVTPTDGEKYYATVDNDINAIKHPLPENTKRGIVLRILNLPNGKQFEILQHTTDADFTAAYMVGQMQHHVVFKTDFNSAKSELTGRINTGELASGILQVTVFNKNGMPLAERLTFVNNKEYLVSGSLTTDTANFSNRSFNRMTLSLKDTIVGSFSVSVYDPSFDEKPRREDNIISNLLLTSDLKGYIHNPAYYFTSDADSVQNALDFVMMTNGWRRFQWNQIKEYSTQKKYTDPGFISLSGKIFLEGTKKAFADKDLIAFIVTTDSSRQTKMIHTNADGNFSLDSLVYFNRARILFSDIKGRKSKFIDVTLTGDSITRRFVLPDLKWNDGEKAPVKFADAKKLADEYNAVVKAEGIMLGGVVVTGKRKTKLEEFESNFVRGPFETPALRTMDFLTEDIGAYANVFDYLRMRVPGLTIVDPNTTDGADVVGYQVFFRQTASISSMGANEMTIFLDEVQVSPDVIATIPAAQIALVKIFPTFVGAAGGGAGGALAIYTKRGDDLMAAMPTSGDVIAVPGYTVMKQFYSPDYSVNKKVQEADNRITLFWDPAIIIAAVNPQLPIRFYNNDRTRKFRVVIEGMTAEGKMLMIEQDIQQAKGF